MSFEIASATHADFLQILNNLEDFWDDDRTRAVHHPMFIFEFGDTSYVVKEDDKVVAYLFGFIAQKDRYGYVHLIGVRKSHQRLGLGKLLYAQFIHDLKKKDIHVVKAITSAGNTASIEFHKKLGMQLFGEDTEQGVPVIKDYSGPGVNRVVFMMEF